MEVVVDGARLYVEVAGDGPPLLLVSGSGAALTAETGPSVSPLSQGFRAAGYDHRGLGRSTADDRLLTMADFAADGFAVADALGWDEFLLFGGSFGGMVAAEMAVSQPSRIRRLVLCCTSSGGAGGNSYPLHERPAPELWSALLDSRPEASEALAALMAAMTSGVPAPREPGYEIQLQARRGHDVWDRLPLITAPTYVAAGAYDAIAPAANGKALASRIPNARFEVFEGGHVFPYQDPGAWTAIVEFLQC